MNERLVGSIIKFLTDHLPSQGSGTRHAGDQNIHDAILTALVDGKMAEDRLTTYHLLLTTTYHYYHLHLPRTVVLRAACYFLLTTYYLSG